MSPTLLSGVSAALRRLTTVLTQVLTGVVRRQGDIHACVRLLRMGGITASASGHGRMTVSVQS